MSEAELILAKLKIVSETEERGMYLCDKEHSKILLDYITNLQEENKKLKKLQKENDKFYDETMKDIKDNLIARINRQECEIHDLKAKLEMYENGVYFSSENDDLQTRIDKATEYINTHIVRDAEYENYMQCEREEKEELIDILEGKE